MITTKVTPAKWDLNDVVALTALEALGGGYVPWTAWSMRPAAVASAVNAIVLGNLTRVVELGAGTSTLYLGRALRDIGGQLVSVEEDRQWATALRALVLREGLADVIEVVHVPLAPLDRPDETPGWPRDAPSSWYSRSVLADALLEDVQLLVVDGPTAGEGATTLVRLPAIPVLVPYLAEQFTIVLDDANRSGEEAIAEHWGRWLAVAPTIYPRTGTAVLTTNDGVFPAL